MAQEEAGHREVVIAKFRGEIYSGEVVELCLGLRSPRLCILPEPSNPSRMTMSRDLELVERRDEFREREVPGEGVVMQESPRCRLSPKFHSSQPHQTLGAVSRGSQYALLAGPTT